jgi:hypothetical protein
MRPGKKWRNANCQKTGPAGGRFGESLDLQVVRHAKSDEILLFLCRFKGARESSGVRKTTTESER